MNGPATPPTSSTPSGSASDAGGPRPSAVTDATVGPSPSGPLAEPPRIPEVSELILAAGHHLLLTTLLSLAVAGSLVALTWSLVPADFEATSFVQVRQRGDTVLASPQSRADDAAFVRAQKSRVVSQPVLAAALQSDSLRPFVGRLPEYQTIRWLKEQTDIEIEAGSEVMTVSVAHPAPEVALALNTAITNAYLEDYVNQTSGDRLRKRQELERAAQEADRELNEQWQRLHEAAEQVGTGNPQQLTVRDEIQLQGYREYAQRLRAAQLRGNQLRSQIAEERLRLQRDTELSEPAIEEAVQRDPEVQSKREQLAAIEVQLRQMSALASRPDAPRIQRLQEDRDHYAEELKALVEDLRPRLREQLLEQQQEGDRSRLDELTRQLELNADEVAFLRDMLAQLEGQIRRTGDDSGVRLEMLRHAIDRQTRLADNLWQSLEQLKIESQAPARVALIESATMPERANRGKQLKTAGAAGLGGWLLTVLGIGYIEWRGCRVRHPRDVLLRARLVLFGTGSFSQGLPLWWRLRHARRDPLESGVKEVAAHLMLRCRGSSRLPSVLVSSATDQEPRHSVALELARTFAGSGRRTLLIDSDFTSSRLTRQLGVPSRPATEEDEAESEAGAGPVATSDPQLSFVGCGGDKLCPGVASRRLTETLKKHSGCFDAVVVNGPAVLTTSESVLLASQVDETVLALVMGRSRWNLLAAARHRMDFAGVSVLGAVLHITPPRRQRERLRVAESASEIPASEQAGGPEEQLQLGVEDLREDLQRATAASRSDAADQASPAARQTDTPPAP